MVYTIWIMLLLFYRVLVVTRWMSVFPKTYVLLLLLKEMFSSASHYITCRLCYYRH